MIFDINGKCRHFVCEIIKNISISEDNEDVKDEIIKDDEIMLGLVDNITFFTKPERIF